MGLENTQKLYLIDFGSSTEYLNKDGTHKLNKKDRLFPGNLMFSSMNICRGSNLSRRDDVESVLYILVYLINQHQLPWSRYSK